MTGVASPSALSEEQRRAWLRLARTENIGPVAFASLIARFPDPREAIDAAPRMARKGGGTLNVPPDAEAKAEIDALAKLGGRIVLNVDAEFPAGLKSLDAPPPLVSVIGALPVLSRDMVAIVGARNASGIGIAFAGRMATSLGEHGLVIASGMARGIDTAAHKAALPTGTVAVLAGGVDVCYPPENRALYDTLAKDGALISEMKLGMQPQPRLFPRRNRIIPGLSRGVVVIEAAEKSGSLITANFALDQGREIFAVPGSPLDPRAKGCNRLIRDGALLTESAEDVIEALRPLLGSGFAEPPAPGFEARIDTHAEDRVREILVEKLGPAPVSIDELIRQVDAPASAVLTILLELELAGRLKRHPGNLVSW